MDLLTELIRGAVSGLGMWLMMTILGVLSYLALKKSITRSLAKFYNDFKKEAIKLNGITIKSKFETKKKKDR